MKVLAGRGRRCPAVRESGRQAVVRWGKLDQTLAGTGNRMAGSRSDARKRFLRTDGDGRVTIGLDGAAIDGAAQQELAPSYENPVGMMTPPGALQDLVDVPAAFE